MPSRQVVPTDDTLQSGQPLSRAFIAQLDEEFAQLYANLIGTMDDIVNNPEMPATARVNATKEMRYLLSEQAKLLNDIERRQDAQEMENRSRNLRQMVAKNPRKALEFIDSELAKLSEFRDFVAKLAEKSMALIPPPPAEDIFDSVDDEPF